MKSLLLIYASLILLFFSCKNNSVDESDSGNLLNLNDSNIIEKLSDQIRNNPSNADLFAQRSIVYTEKGKIEDALNDINIAVRLDSLKPDYYIRQSSLYLLMGKSEKAKQSLEKSNQLIPDNQETLLKLAELYLLVKDYKVSEEYLNLTEQINPNHERIFFLRGLISQETGNIPMAIIFFQKALEKNPEFYEVNIILGLLFAEKNDSIAISYYKNAIRLFPGSIEAYYNLAMYYQENDNPLKAIENYTFIIDSIDQSYKLAYYNIGYNYLVNIKNYDIAIEYFDKAINIDHRYAEAYYNKGVCYEMKKDYKNARLEFETANRLKENYEKAIEGLNRIQGK
ncbi:MAG: tetratricopeptide repeat protein [Bacteroidota bacterium]